MKSLRRFTLSTQHAKDHYLGKNGHQRLNCAQSILAAFKAHFQVGDQEIEKFLAHGGGNAPGGVCGAYFAAKSLIKKHHPDKLTEFENFFLAQAGSLKCRDIRQLKKLSCLGCIEKSAEFVSKLTS